eukprot:jgi/Chrzof1/13024/Cz07g17030.t1
MNESVSTGNLLAGTIDQPNPTPEAPDNTTAALNGAAEADPHNDSTTASVVAPSPATATPPPPAAAAPPPPPAAALEDRSEMGSVPDNTSAVAVLTLQDGAEQRLTNGTASTLTAADSTPAVEAFEANVPSSPQPLAAGTKRPASEADLADAPSEASPGPSTKRQHTQHTSVYRLVIPQRKVGLLIGRNGTTINELESTTGAKVIVMTAIPTCDDRVVIVYSDDSDSDSPTGAQAAVLKIQHLLAAAEQGSNAPTTQQSARLLISTSQTNSILGDAAAVFRRLKEQSGALVRVLPISDSPLCALSNDRLLQMLGTSEQVVKALELAAHHLRQHPALERPGGPHPELAAMMAAEQASHAPSSFHQHHPARYMAYGTPYPAYGAVPPMG